MVKVMIDPGRITHKIATSVLSKALILGLALTLAPSMVCQGQVLLKYQVEDIASQKGELYFPDSLSRANYVQAFLHSLHLEGYPTANIRTKTFVEDTLHVRLEAGPPFNWLLLRQGNLDDGRAKKVGYQESAFRHRPLNFSELKRFFDQILVEAQNTGYPFATVRLDSMDVKEGGLEAAINFDPGPYITFDTLEIIGDSKTKPLYLSRLLRVPPAAPFSQTAIDRALKALQKVPYLQLVDQPALTFQN